LKQVPEKAVMLRFVDAGGTVLRTFTSDAKDPPRVPTQAGANRFVWDLRGERPTKVTQPKPPNPYGINEEAGLAPWALPGDYAVELVVDGTTYRQPFTVTPDPRLAVSDEALRQQYAMKEVIRDRLSQVHEALNTLRQVRGQVDGWVERAQSTQAAGSEGTSELQRLLEAGARWQWRPQGDIVEGMRESKDEGEVALIEQAAGMATRALANALQQVRAGITELEIAGILEKALRDEGSEAHPFETIVASGPRSALPHARASRRVIESGDLLLLDFGAEYGGYCSDVTRTVVVGRASDEVRGLYDIVRVANERAAGAVHAGMTGSDADAVARDYISAAGFGGDFGHSLGHGIGLEVHEAPRLARTAAAKLPADTVVTIEPGIYRPEWGGVRIEDDVYLSADGPRLLTDFTHELLELSA